MTERILLSIIAIIMLLLTIRKKEKKSIILTAGLTIGILITWSGIPIIISMGLLLYMITTLFIALINIKSKTSSKFNQTTIVLVSICAFGSHLFNFMHWPYANQMRLVLFIPILFYIISLVKGMAKRKEFGYLTIMICDFLMNF